MCSSSVTRKLLNDNKKKGRKSSLREKLLLLPKAIFQMLTVFTLFFPPLPSRAFCLTFDWLVLQPTAVLIGCVYTVSISATDGFCDWLYHLLTENKSTFQRQCKLLLYCVIVLKIFSLVGDVTIIQRDDVNFSRFILY